jgi:hypothetical protein
MAECAVVASVVGASLAETCRSRVGARLGRAGGVVEAENVPGVDERHYQRR